MKDKLKNWTPGVDLPPVGEKCLYNFTDYDSGELWEKGDELEVIAHKEAYIPVAVVWNKRTMSASSRSAKNDGRPMFLPIRSHRDKVVDAASKTVIWMYGASDFEKRVLGPLYEAGFLKLPDDES